MLYTSIRNLLSFIQTRYAQDQDNQKVNRYRTRMYSIGLAPACLTRPLRPCIFCLLEVRSSQNRLRLQRPLQATWGLRESTLPICQMPRPGFPQPRCV